MDMILFQSVLACAVASLLPPEPCQDGAGGYLPPPMSRSGSHHQVGPHGTAREFRGGEKVPPLLVVRVWLGSPKIRIAGQLACRRFDTLLMPGLSVALPWLT
jgi:hypothetical protein